MALITLEGLEHFGKVLSQKIEQLFVRKEAGKALSSNDFTNFDKVKLEEIEYGANKYIHPSGDGNLHVIANGLNNGGKFFKSGNTAGNVYWDNVRTSDVVNLDNEIARIDLSIKETDQNLKNDISAETTRSKNEEQNISNKLDSEVSRAKNAEQQLTNDLSAEVTRAKATESTLTNNLNNEITRSTNAESSIRNDMNTELAKKQNVSDKGKASGYAELDANGKVPLGQMNDAILGNVKFQGLWNASTNSPALPTTPVTMGHYYVVSTAGTQFGITFDVGDWVIAESTKWNKVDNTDAVTSVAGRTGNVVLDKGDVNLGNVPNVGTNDQTPTYTEASSLATLLSGEKLSISLGKIMKAISTLISHIADNVSHITSTERINWNSAKTHADSAHAPSGAQVNVIETVQKNGTAITPSNKTVNVAVPTKVSELTNDKGFITSTDVDTSQNHTHSNKSVLDGITSALITAWNVAKTHADSAHAPSGAQANVIETVQKNGATITPSNKVVNVTVPVKVSELSNDSGFITSDSTKLPLAGGTMTDMLLFSNNAGGIQGTIGDNDYYRMIGRSTASNAGYLEIATADDGTEPIYFRQYTGAFATLVRTLTLLDGSGNSIFPGTITASKFIGALQGIADAAAKLSASRTISFTGDVTGTFSTDLSGNVSTTLTQVANKSNQKVSVSKNSTTVTGTRKQINFKDGSNVTVTVADNSTNDAVDVTIAATNTTYSEATTSANGLMSSSDKTKLNGIATGAQVNPTIDSAMSSSSTNPVQNKVIQAALDGKSSTSHTHVTTYTATISTTWTGSSAPYTQTITVTGILATDVPIVDILLSSTTATAVAEEMNWSYVSKITTAANSITVTCNKKKPTVAMNIQLRVVR